MGATLAKGFDAFAGKAAAQGLEPRLPRPERGVLPLHQAATAPLRIRDQESGGLLLGEGGFLGDHLPRLRQFFGATDAETAGDAVALQVPDRELAALAVAAPDLAVPLVGGADVLEARPVGEVAEEVRHDLVVGLGAEHIGGGVDALLHRHVPVLDVDAAAVDDALIRAAVAGGIDARRGGPELGVADDATVADLDSRSLREHRVGPNSGADDDRVALDREPALAEDRLDPAIALEGAQGLAAVEGDAVLFEPLLEPATDVLAEGAREGDVLHRDDRAFRPLRGQRGGDLAADVATADEHDVLGPLGIRANGVGVAEGTEVVDALVLGPLDAEDVDHRSRPEQGLAEGDLFAALDLRRLGLEVKPHHVLPGQQLDPVLLVPGATAVDVGVLAAGVAAQVLLRDRRPFVGRLRLAPDQQDRGLRTAPGQLR